MNRKQDLYTNTHWVIPFDGSDHSIRALNLAIQEGKERQNKPKLLVLNVQLPLSADITRFIDGKTVDEFHREAGEKVLLAAKAPLEDSGLTHDQYILVGQVAHTISEFAASHNCSLIVMGTHGHTTVAGLIMGSVTTRLLHETNLPVLLTK